MVRPAAGLNRDHACLQLSHKFDYSFAAHASPKHNGSAVIQPDDAAAILAQINPENCYLHCQFPPNRLPEDSVCPQDG